MSELLLLFKKILKTNRDCAFFRVRVIRMDFQQQEMVHTHTHTYTDIARLSAAVQHGHENCMDRSKIQDLRKTMILKQISQAGPEYCFH